MRAISLGGVGRFWAGKGDGVFLLLDNPSGAGITTRVPPPNTLFHISSVKLLLTKRYKLLHDNLEQALTKKLKYTATADSQRRRFKAWRSSFLLADKIERKNLTPGHLAGVEVTSMSTLVAPCGIRHSFPTYERIGRIK